MTETVDFSEPMNTSYIDVSLYGELSAAPAISPASEVWQTGPNGPDSELVLTYSNLPDDTYTLNLYAGGFQDLVGNTLQNTYTAQLRRGLRHRGFPDADPRQPAGQPDLRRATRARCS